MAVTRSVASTGSSARLALCGAALALLTAACGGTDPNAAAERSVPQTDDALAAVESGRDGTTVHAPEYDPRQSLAPMIEAVKPAVVSIIAHGKTAFGPGGRGVGGGSGFVMSSTEGIVVTNHHVVEGATRLEVRLADKRMVEAELLGSDQATDLAVLKIDADNLSAVELGQSGKLRVGDWMVAIGSPGGLEHSASVGILSARGRGSLGLYRHSYIDFLQTDADIAPGSSGGPLFDLKGHVVGITTAVGGGHSAGFAIPIDQAKRIIPQLQASGKVVRGWLGASSSARPSNEQGAQIGEVYDDTPAAEAGLRSGDLVQTLDGLPIANFNELRNAIAAMDPGHTVRLQVDRDGKTLELTAVLGRRPDDNGLDRLADGTRGERRHKSGKVPGRGPRLGIGAREHREGLEVVSVEPQSLADELSLQPGDVVVKLNGQRIKEPSDVREALRLRSIKTKVEFIRGGEQHTVSLKRS